MTLFRDAVGMQFKKRSAVVPLVIAVLALLPACGLIAGGPTQEELDALQQQLETAQLEADSAFDSLTAEKGKVATLQQQINAANAADTSDHITLELARIRAVQFAQQNLELYSPELQAMRLVWEVTEATEGDEFFFIKVSYKPFENFTGTPGLEEFIVRKNGDIEFRQVLSPPIDAPPPAEGQSP